jgi:hypothetical protein
MKSRLVTLCSLVGVLISIGCGSGSKESLASSSAGTKPRKDPGITRRKGETKPVTLTPFTDTEGAWWLAPDAPMYAETFAYDPSRGKAFPPDGPKISTAETPLPVRITSFNFATYSGGVSAEYSNVVFDFSKVSDDTHRLGLGVIMNRQWPSLLVQKGKRVLIDADYIVYPDNLESVKPGGPFATLEIEVVLGGTDKKAISGASVLVFRGGGRLGPFSTNTDGKVLIHLEDLSEPTVRVKVQSTPGSAEMPVPLPVKGADKDVFIQEVLITVGTAK